MLRRWSTRDRTVSWAPSEFGKSQLLAGFIAWRIGRDPSLRVGLLSGSVAQAERLLRLVEIVLRSPAFRRIFPEASIERSNASELFLANRPATSKDATVIAASYDLSSLLGSRLDMVAGDDLMSREATRSPAARDRASQDWSAIAGSRLAPGGSIAVVGTSEHSDDVLHRLSRLPGWDAARYPAIDEAGFPTWPERCPSERLDARRLELGPVGFQRSMMCVPLDAASLIFDPDHIENALRLGSAEHLSPAGCACIVGLDPAWTVGAGSDESGIVLVAIDDEGFRYVSHIEGLRVNHDALAARVVQLARANRATVYCESNGAGGVFADIIGKQVPCKPLNTSATSKRARVEALSAEMASGRWVFRQPLGSPSPQLTKLCDELLTFSFESHCGDRASALLLACEGARAHESRPKMRQFRIDLHSR